MVAPDRIEPRKTPGLDGIALALVVLPHPVNARGANAFALPAVNAAACARTKLAALG